MQRKENCISFPVPSLLIYLFFVIPQIEDSCEQLSLVAAFTVSSYATTAVRTAKPFNPLLGETYECDRTDDLGWRALNEQVRIHFLFTWIYFIFSFFLSHIYLSVFITVFSSSSLWFLCIYAQWPRVFVFFSKIFYVRCGLLVYLVHIIFVSISLTIETCRESDF